MVLRANLSGRGNECCRDVAVIDANLRRLLENPLSISRQSDILGPWQAEYAIDQLN
jgi:hypothetical protein